MRAALGYVIGATVSLTGGVADLAYINVRLVPRMMEEAKPIVQTIEEPPPSPPVEVEPPAEVEPPVVEAAEPEPLPEITFDLAAVVRFKTSSDELDGKARAEIGRVAKRLVEDPGLLARTDGHADLRGPSPYNQDLSDRRSAAVARELERLGVKSARIERRAFGEEMASKKWVLDRRVEISVGKDPRIGGSRR